MGIQRPKRLPHGKVGRVKPTQHQLRKPRDWSDSEWSDYLKGFVGLTEMPRILVWVRTHNAEARSLVRLMLRVTECKVREEMKSQVSPVVKFNENKLADGGRPTLEGDITVLTISGGVEQLKRAITFSCVIKWELVMSAKAPGGYNELGRKPKHIQRRKNVTFFPGERTIPEAEPDDVRTFPHHVYVGYDGKRTEKGAEPILSELAARDICEMLEG